MPNNAINSSNGRRGDARRRAAACSAALFLQLVCATPGAQGTGIEALHVFALPVALNLDSSPGPDGFGVTVYASAETPAKGLPITAGQLEILMFDGALSAKRTIKAAPRQSWAFTATDLKEHMVKTSLGTGYRFTPRWTNAPPQNSRITIVVQYAPVRGALLQSEPTTIPLTVK